MSNERIRYTVFGPFGPGDSLRVYRLQRRRISLDLHRNLVHPYSPLWEAWLALMTQNAMGQPTYVLYHPHDGEAYIQVRYRRHQAAVDIASLAPVLDGSKRTEGAWRKLLDGIAIELAGLGIQRLFAGLPASGAQVDAFHQSGFVLYAGEDLYLLDHPQSAEGVPHLDSLRAQRAEDWQALQRLCVAITPQQVRQAEGGITLTAGRNPRCQRSVLPSQTGQDLAAAVTICPGGLSHWLSITLHPDAHDLSDSILAWGLGALSEHAPKPVFCSVRQYQGGLRAALEDAGFVLYESRSLMVKHTSVRVATLAQEQAHNLNQMAEPIPPAYRHEGEPDMVGPDARLATDIQAKHS